MKAESDSKPDQPPKSTKKAGKTDEAPSSGTVSVQSEGEEEGKESDDEGGESEKEPSESEAAAEQ